jgi:hypothetical protein
VVCCHSQLDWESRTYIGLQNAYIPLDSRFRGNDIKECGNDHAGFCKGGTKGDCLLLSLHVMYLGFCMGEPLGKTATLDANPKFA